MTTFTVGDTAPRLAGVVSANLTGATAVVHIKRPDGTVISRTANIDDGPGGAWSIGWQAGDLASTRLHKVELEVTFSNTEVQTFALDARGNETSFYVRGEYA